jgi:chromosome segregation ATPase
MLKEAQGINSSAIQDLRAIKEELAVLHERMELMEKKRESVSQQVFERVSADYEARQTALEEQAAPLKEVVRSEYTKINGLVEQLEEKASKARLVREELEFRKELGEFDEAEFQERLEECQHDLEEVENELAEITSMRDEIAEAFPSADDLIESEAAEEEDAAVADTQEDEDETADAAADTQEDED